MDKESEMREKGDLERDIETLNQGERKSYSFSRLENKTEIKCKLINQKFQPSKFKLQIQLVKI